MNNAGNFDPFVDAVEAAKDLKIMRTIRRDYLSDEISLIQLLSSSISNSLALKLMQNAISNGIDVKAFIENLPLETENEDQIMDMIKSSLIEHSILIS